METATLRLSDLLQIRDAINASYYHNLAMDMAESYRKLNRQNRGAPMTLSLKTSLDVVNQYIEAATGREPTAEESGDVAVS